MRSWVVAVLLLGAAAGSAEAQGNRTLQFSLDRPGAASVQYTVQVDESGRGSYAPRLGLPAGVGQGEGVQPIQVNAASTKKLFAAVPAVEGGRCETHSKGIAQTGAKVLHYQGAGKTAECTYNYSDDDRVNEATLVFEGVAETLLAGDRLRAKLRFDRLGLDAELDALQEAVNAHRALDLENIAPVLNQIIASERVMDRARRKAEILLNGAGGAQAGEDAPSSDR